MRLSALLTPLLLISQAAFAQVVVRVDTPAELISAIEYANTRTEQTRIRVAPGQYDFTRTFSSDYGPSMLPPITSDVVIFGHLADDTVLSAQRIARHFVVLEGGRLTLRHVTLTNGTLECKDQGCEQAGGGAVANVGGVLRLDYCVVSNNSVYYSEGLGISHGGGISSVDGELHINHSRIYGNLAMIHGGGIGLVNGTATLSDSIVSSNGLSPYVGNGGWGDGAGINVVGTTLTITRSTVSANTGPRNFEFNTWGAGIKNTSGDVRLIDSAVTENVGPYGGAGGGIYNAGKLLVRNSTISGNVNGILGGGIYNTGELILRSATLANNEISGVNECCYPGAASGTPTFPAGCDHINNPEACYLGGGGLWNEPSGTVRVESTALAQNFGPASMTVPDCGGSLISAGHNALGTSAQCTFQARPTDQIDIDARISTELHDSGEPGEAHYPLLTDSPLIDAGGLIGHDCQPRDQLGNTRNDGNGDGEVRCDVGAVERLSLPATP
jgi:hypothetical protein